MFVDKAVKMQELLADMFFFQAGFELPPGEEKDERVEKKDAAQQIIDYTISIGPLNVYSLNSAYADTIKKFQAQTTDIANIYSPVSETFQSPVIQSSVTKSLYGNSDDKEISRNTQQETISSNNENFYSSLKESALVLKELETAGNRMPEISMEKRSLPQIQGKIPATEFLSAEFKESGAGYMMHEPIEEFSEYINTFSKYIQDISNSFQSTMLEAQKMTEISSLKEYQVMGGSDHEQGIMKSMEILNSRMLEAQKLTEITSLKEFQVREESVHEQGIIKSMEALNSRMLEAQKMTEIFSLKELSMDAISIPDSQVGNANSTISHEQKMIEIPPFMPKTAGTAIQTGKLNEMIARESVTSAASQSSTFSNAFKTISDYASLGSEINNQVTEYLENGNKTIGDIFSQGSPVDLVLNGSNPAIDIIQGIVEGNAGGTTGDMNIAYNISTAEALYREGNSSIKDIIQAVPSTMTGMTKPLLSLPPFSMENTMQVLYGAQKETPAGSAKSGDVRFQNTFNIVVNIKGKGEETEMRDLGKKIGHILSEEMRRYGGV